MSSYTFGSRSRTRTSSPPRRRPRIFHFGHFLVIALTVLCLALLRHQPSAMLNQYESGPWNQIPSYSGFNFTMTNDQAPECKALSPSQVDFTLVSQTSMNRLWLLEEHCRRWGAHPISLTVGGLNVEEEDVYQQIRAMPSCDLNLITFSVVSGFNGGLDYPINRMRNVAIADVSTSHAFYIDMDFLMSDGVYEELALHRDVLVNLRTAIVVPAFGLVPFCSQGAVPTNDTCTKAHIRVIPNTKKELQEIYIHPEDNLHGGGMNAFESRNNLHGHESTNYDAWLHQPDHTLEPLTCFTSDKFEPYLVFRNCRDVPPFPEAFTGRGRNKIVWVQQLRRAGWSFLRTGSSFLTHLPHEKSFAHREWVAEAKAGKSHRTREIGESFRRWMIDQVPDQHVVPYCNASFDETHVWYSE